MDKSETHVANAHIEPYVRPGQLAWVTAGERLGAWLTAIRTSTRLTAHHRQSVGKNQSTGGFHIARQ